MYIAGLDQYYIPSDTKYPSWVQKLYNEQEEVQTRVWLLEGLENLSEADEITVDIELCRLYDRLNEIHSQLWDYA